MALICAECGKRPVLNVPAFLRDACRWLCHKCSPDTKAAAHTPGPLEKSERKAFRILLGTRPEFKLRGSPQFRKNVGGASNGNAR